MPPPPSDFDQLLADRDGVEQVLGVCGVNVRIDADRTGVVTAAETRVLTNALQYGTSYVYNRIGQRYSFAEASENWEVWWWASVCATHMLCLFRCGVPPAAVQSEFERVDALLMLVANGQYRPWGMRSRSGSGVSWDGMRLNPRARYKQLVREVSISDGPRQQTSPQINDWASVFLVEWNW